jgi:hypothetical protein
MVHLFSCWSSKPCTMLRLYTFNVESQVPHKHISENCEKFSSEWFKTFSSNYSHTLLAGVQLMKKVQLKIPSNYVKVAQWMFQVPITCLQKEKLISTYIISLVLSACGGVWSSFPFIRPVIRCHPSHHPK